MPTHVRHTKNGKIKNILAYSILVIVASLIICKVVSYKIIDRSLSQFQNNKNYNLLHEGLSKAATIYPNKYVATLQAKVYIQEASSIYTNPFVSMSIEKQGIVKDLLAKAIRSANTAVLNDINDSEVYILRANIYEAYLSVATGTNYELAKVDYDRAMTLDPYNPEIMLGLSKLEYSRGKKENAANLIDKTISIKYNYTPAYVTLANMLESEGKTKAKISVLEQALKSDINNQNIAYALAREYLRDGNVDDYRIIMETLIKLNPNLEDLQKELNQVKLNSQVKVDTKSTSSSSKIKTSKVKN